MKFENTNVYNFENALRGMRNPLESWGRSDSKFGFALIRDFTADSEVAAAYINKEESSLNETDKIDFQRGSMAKECLKWLQDNGIKSYSNGVIQYNLIGPNDMYLARKLILGGSEHRKFLRQIFVTVDITAPMYWWSEFDTYKVGTTANSTSKMHKITSKPITLDCFEVDDYNNELVVKQTVKDNDPSEHPSSVECFKTNHLVQMAIDSFELLRQKYLETNDKRYWKELIRWLPTSWLQTRTVTMNYENLRTIYHQRKHHKLSEWSKSFCNWVKTLPYASSFITE